MKKRLSALILLLLAGTLLLAGCGVDDIDVSGYGQQEIELVGLTEDDRTVTITPKELKALDCVTKKTHSTSDKIGEVRATGPLLDTVLEEYGVSQADFTKIKIYGEDDYDISLRQEFLAENDVILAFGINGEPLDAEGQPVRIIIPESDSAYWIRMVKKIEFIK